MDNPPPEASCIIGYTCPPHASQDGAKPGIKCGWQHLLTVLNNGGEAAEAAAAAAAAAGGCSGPLSDSSNAPRAGPAAATLPACYSPGPSAAAAAAAAATPLGNGRSIQDMKKILQDSLGRM